MTEHDYYGKAVFEALKGQTLISVAVTPSKDEVLFATRDGRKFHMYHQSDCCETVTLEEIIGDLHDLIGEPLLQVEKVTYDDSDSSNPIVVHLLSKIKSPESVTWTFYKLATIKGSVTLRWVGESNGYYSEEVTFEELTKE